MDIIITRRRASDFAKAMRASLARQGVTVSHAVAMTTLANMLGFAETRAMVAGLPDDRSGAKTTKGAGTAPPIVRFAAYHAGGRCLLLDAAPALQLLGAEVATKIAESSGDDKRQILIKDMLAEMESRPGYEAITPFLDEAGNGDHTVDMEICRSDVADWLAATGHSVVACSPTKDSWPGAFEPGRAVLFPSNPLPPRSATDGDVEFEESFDEIVSFIQTLPHWDARELGIWLNRIADEGSTEDTAAVLRFVLAMLEGREQDAASVAFTGSHEPAHSILERLSFRPGASRSWGLWVIRRLIEVLDRGSCSIEDELLRDAMRQGIAARKGK